MIRYCIAMVCIIAVQLQAQKLKIFYLGLSSESIPAIRQDFDGAMRDRLSVHPMIHLADSRRTRILKEKAGFSYDPWVGGDIVQRLVKTTGDSTLIVWGQAEKHEISIHRKNLIQAWAVGRLRVKLMMYSLSVEQFAYVGAVEAEYSLKKGVVFFRPAAKITHLTAADRQFVNDSLIARAVQKGERAVIGVIRSRLKSGQTLEESVSGIEDRQQEPRVEDLFGIPSVEGETLQPQEIPQTDGLQEQQTEDAETTEPPPSLPAP
ncbi:MAG: hypothetical protein ACOC4C_01450 [Fibrobacterota bacterium]